MILALPRILQAQSEESLQFVENKGQFEPQVLFRVQLRTGFIYLEKNAITFKIFDDAAYLKVHQHLHEEKPDLHNRNFRGHAFRYQFENVNANPSIKGENAFKEKFNYFLGNDRNKWASNVGVFASVVYANIYPSIDLVVKSQFGQLKYEWHVHPRGNPTLIKILPQGLDSLTLRQNKLLLHTSIGSFPDKDLKSWISPISSISSGIIAPIESQYSIDNGKIGYLIDDYKFDASQELIIDPILIFSTYSGSKGDNFGYTATYDDKGCLYAGGITDNTHGEYPITLGAFQTTCKGGRGLEPVNLPCDITISKYDSSGKNLLYATYMGGIDDDYPHSMVVNGDTELVVFGTTYSGDFPITSFAYDKTHNSLAADTFTDIVIFKLSVRGDQLKASTFYGGNKHDGLTDDPLRYNYADEFRGEVLTDKANNIYVVSSTLSGDIPLKNASKTKLEGPSDGLCLKFSKNLDQLLWATYFGGNGSDGIYSLEFDKFGNIYVGGGTFSTNLPTHTTAIRKGPYGDVDGFLAVYNKTTFGLDRATYYGTSAYDQIYFLEIDKNGDVYATGQTEGNITPTPGAYTLTKNSGQFIVIADAGLNTVKRQTVFGTRANNPNISPSAFLVDSCGNIYLSGWGSNVFELHRGTTNGLPVTSNALQSTTDGHDFYLAVFGKNLSSLLFGSFFGGNLSRDHVDGGTSRFDKRGIIYQSVCSSCPNTPGATLNDFPTTPNSAFPVNVSYRCSNAAFKIDFQISNLVKARFIPDAIVCGPADVQFTNQSDGNGKYKWNFGDGKFSTDKDPKHTFTKLGKFTITLVATDSNTCNISDTAERFVEVIKRSNADFTYETFVCASQIEIKNNSSDYGSLIWDFGDTTTSTLAQPGVHNYKKPGQYTVMLITDPDRPCPDTAKVTLDISGTPADELVPLNVFTPDGDLFNDCFHFKGMLNSCSEFKISIFNRWGQKVFETKDFNECWNGKLNNLKNDCPEGTYFYICEYKGESPEIEKRFSGTVTLIRNNR